MFSGRRKRTIKPESRPGIDEDFEDEGLAMGEIGLYR
jgi:hypothetical protein